MTIKLLTEQYLEFLSLKGGCTGSSESIHVKMPYRWKSHVTAQIFIIHGCLHKNTYGATIKIAGHWRAAIGFRKTSISIRVYKIETKLCLKMKPEENETLNYDIFFKFR